MNPIDEMKEAMKSKRTKEDNPIMSDFLSTGSTLLNLGISGRWQGGFRKGKYYLLVGDSTSGKTWLSLNCLAEASLREDFDDYRFVHDDVEGGAGMDIARYFGKDVAMRLEPPSEGGPSKTIEEFYFNIDNLVEEGDPFIYILDSQDCLGSEYADKKFDEKKNAFYKDEQAKGDYGDGKAKVHSQYLRKLMSDLEKIGSILIIINQTRDNLVSPLTGKTRSGGRALRFYANVEVWTSVRRTLKKTVRKKPRQIGVDVLAKIKKNRVSGREREVLIPIYHSYGIDDIGSIVDYLVDEDHWKKAKNSPTIKAQEFDFSGPREKLIRYIEDEEAERELRDIAAQVWQDIEEKSAVKRKPRY